MSLFVAIMNILAGVVLLTDMWRTIPAIGVVLDKFVRTLVTFQAVIGVLAITAGAVYFSPAGIVAIIAGLAVGFEAFTFIPAFGEWVEQFAKSLLSFQTILGFTAIIVGIVGVF